MRWFRLWKPPPRWPWALHMRVNILPHGGSTLVQARLPIAPGPLSVRLVNLFRTWSPPGTEVIAELPAEAVERLHDILSRDYPRLLWSNPSNCFDGMSAELLVQRADEEPVGCWFQGW